MITVAGLVRLIDESGAGCMVIDGTLTETGITDHVFDEDITEHSSVNSFGLSVQKTLGLLDENSAIDQQVYNTDHRLTSARKRTYSNKLSVGTDSDVLATYTITATWSGQELTSYKMVRV